MFFQSITCCRRENVKVMADRIKLMRQKIYEKLKSLGTPGSWEHLVQQIGMFGYTGLNGMLLLCILYDSNYNINTQSFLSQGYSSMSM